MAEFIEVHDKKGEVRLLNAAWIMVVEDRGGEAHIRLSVTEAGAHFGIATQETYEQVREKIDMACGWGDVLENSFCSLCGDLLVDGRCTGGCYGRAYNKEDATDE